MTQKTGGALNATRGRKPIETILDPFLRFTSSQTSGGILLLGATVVALLWANLSGQNYEHFFETYIGFSFGDFQLSKTLRHWINDGLMVIFFFVVGLEIKRELLIGELSSPRKAALPIAAALGGMLAPATFFLLFNYGAPGQPGWGIPMATDIAFTIGLLTLLGKAVPFSLKIFVTALAIVDDIGAVLVIALFYSQGIGWWSLGGGLVILALLVLFNALGVRHPLGYALLGVALWLAFLQSGVHTTIAGVLLAMTIPASTDLTSRDAVQRGRYLLSKLEAVNKSPDLRPKTSEEQAILESLEESAEKAQTPMQRLEHTLGPWSTFVIMPVFALANAGLPLVGLKIADPVALGIIVGLVLGKPLGITFFSWLAVRTGLATISESISWRLLLGGGALAGIGFTMSLFIANLAFPDVGLLQVAKAGILLGSLIAAVVGVLLVGRQGRNAAV